MAVILNIILLLLQVYFLLMNFTVERYYCESPFEVNDNRFLVQETIEFCQLNNQLFLQRPEWMVKATCFHSYVFPIGYFAIIVLILTNSWRRFAVPILLFIGAKMNAIFFYHYMEFTSNVPPTNLGPYFSVEGPYVLSMAIVVYNVWSSLRRSDTVSNNPTKNKTK
jgi:hypothetical protein